MHHLRPASRLRPSMLLALLAICLVLPFAPAFAQSKPRAVSPVHAPQLVDVYRSPSCGCCLLWVEHLRGAGFKVNVHDTADMQAVKQRLGVPESKQSCHTASVGGYFVEGHVPATDIRRLLKEKPDARGVAVPGMPLGSPGMEVPGRTVQPYAVELVGRDGSTRVYSRHGQ